MSRSPERISSYRRHFEDSSISSYQVRVSSPSPTRRDARNASIGYSTRAGAGKMCVNSVGRRTVSAARRSRMTGVGMSAGAMVCVGPSGEPAIDLDAAAAENQEFLSTRTTERQEMIVLNDRLAVYIDKVRSLEQQNKLLEAEIEAYQNRFQKPSGLRLIYEEQLKELRKIAEQMRVQRDISLAAKESTAAHLEAIKLKYEEALEMRKKAELDIEAFRPDVDKATSSRIVLEKKLEQLEVEIEFLKRIHEQEIEELMKQIYTAHVSAQSAFTLPDLAGALKQIQTQYDDIAAKNLQEMDSWYKNKFEDLTQKTSKHVDKVRSFRDAIASSKKDIQSKEREMDSLRARNEALEAQIQEMQQKYKKELEDLQARIEALQLEMKSTKEKIALHLREYQDLLNIKMALEIEITTYRKLIEGEDLRLSGMVQTLSLTSCSTSAISAGVSLSGGSVDGVGGMSSGLMGGSRGGVGGMRGGVGMGGDMAADAGVGSLGDRVGAEGTSNWNGSAGRAGGVDMTGNHVIGGVGVGVGASAGAVSTGRVSGAGGMNGTGVSGLASGSITPITDVGGITAGGSNTSPGSLGTGHGGVSTGPGSLGTGHGGVSTGPGGLGSGAGGVSTGPGGLGSGAGGVSTGSGTLGSGAGGVSTGPGGVSTGPGSLGSGAGGLGTGPGGVSTGPGALGSGAGGLGSGAGGVSTGPGALGSGAGGLGSGPGGVSTGPGALGSGPGGVSTSSVGLSSETGGSGTGSGVASTDPGSLGSRAGDLSTTDGSLGTGPGGMENLGICTGGIGESSVSGIGVGAAGDTTRLTGSMDRAGNGFGGGNGVVGEGKGYGVGGGIDRNGSKVHGLSPAGTSGGIRGSAGGESIGEDKEGKGDIGGARMGYGSDGYDRNIEAYAEQAVELTERRTVLIRTVKNEDDVMEMDHQEQTYTISGAADDSDVD